MYVIGLPRIKIASIIMALLLLTIMFQASCATIGQTSYTTLSISKVTFEASLPILGDLYKQGIIGEAMKDKIIDKAEDYKQIHNKAVTALLKYKKSGLTTDEESYNIILSKAALLMAEYLALVQPYLRE